MIFRVVPVSAVALGGRLPPRPPKDIFGKMKRDLVRYLEVFA